MNNSYFSSSSNEYSYEYYSPSITACPFHSPSSFYLSPTQLIHTPRASYSYYQQQPTQVFSPSIQQYDNTPVNIDCTPLRRHQCFKKNELQILHQIYIQDAYPSINILQQLAIQLKVSVDKVRQWFKNRRHSDKKKQTTVRASTTT